ncbi:MAG TPA: ester cyclase [Rhizobiaceae bacterium]|nr:ester cyclase [Rhizobiaceae bacterium]
MITPARNLAAAMLSLATLTGSALADDKATVQAFYNFLSNPSSKESATALMDATSANWESLGDYSGVAKTRDAFVQQVGGFGQLIPDLEWKVEEMLQDGNRIVVRGHATGTPVGPMFGVDGQGRSFSILSIDIHTVEDGKIVRTWHVEDWAGALRQLSGK